MNKVDRKDVVKKIKIEIIDATDRTKCSKTLEEPTCCCNCKYNKTVNGHPWVNGQSILTTTGLRVCTYSDEGSVILSHRHGLCEGWEQHEKKK